MIPSSEKERSLLILITIILASLKEIAELFKVNPRTISKWASKWIETGIIEPASGKKRVTAYLIGKEAQRRSA